jgi:hypothetical protein
MKRSAIPGFAEDSQHSVAYLHQIRRADGYRIGFCKFVHGSGLWYSQKYWRDERSEMERAVHSGPGLFNLDSEIPVDIDAEQDIWLQFARIKSDDDIVRFANRFGLLEVPKSSQACAIPLRKNANLAGIPDEGMSLPRRLWAYKNDLDHLSDDELERRYPDDWYGDIAVTAEPVSLWKAYLSEIKPLVRLFSAIRNDQVAYLKRVFRWVPWQDFNNFTALRYKPENDEFLLTKELFEGMSKPGDPINIRQHVFDVGPEHYLETRNDPALSVEFKKHDDYVTPARMFLINRINWYLQHNAKVGLVFNSDFSQQQLRIIPDNLIYAIWYQFAKAVAAGPEIAVCEKCGEYYVKKNKRGSEQKYCSNACKVKSHRQRKVAPAA